MIKFFFGYLFIFLHFQIALLQFSPDFHFIPRQKINLEYQKSQDYVNLQLETQILSEIRLPSGENGKKLCKILIQKPLELSKESQLYQSDDLLDICNFEIDKKEFIGVLTNKSILISNTNIQIQKLELPKFINNSVTGLKILNNQVLLFNKNEIFYGEIKLNENQVEINFENLESIKIATEIMFTTIIENKLLVIDKNFTAQIFNWKEKSIEAVPSSKLNLKEIIQKYHNFSEANFNEFKFIHNEIKNDLLILNPQKGIIIFPLRIFVNLALDFRTILFIDISNIQSYATYNEQLFIITEDSELLEISYRSTEKYQFINRRLSLDKTFKVIGMNANQQFLYIFYENYFLSFEHSIPKQYLTDDQVIVKLENHTFKADQKIAVSIQESKIFVFNKEKVNKLEIQQQINLSCSLKKLKKQKIRQVEVKALTKNCSLEENILPFNSFCQQQYKIKFIKKNENNAVNEQNNTDQLIKKETEKVKQELEAAYHKEKLQLQENFNQQMEKLKEKNKQQLELTNQNNQQSKTNEDNQKELEKKFQDQLNSAEDKYYQQLNESLNIQDELKKQLVEKEKQYQKDLEVSQEQIKKKYEEIINEKIQDIQQQFGDNQDIAKLPNINFKDTEIIGQTDEDEPTAIDTKFLLFFLILVIILIVLTFYFKICKQWLLKLTRNMLGVEIAQKVEETFNLKEELENEGIQLCQEDQKGNDNQGEEIFETNIDEI